MGTNSEIAIISMDNTDASSSTWSRPYPPTKRDGVVDEYDKPFFYYGHLEDNEYFYKSKLPQEKEKEIIYTVDHLPLFQEARRQWKQSQQSKQVFNGNETDSVGDQFDTDSVPSEE
ncbi:unnamed protein product [Adineta steineri]|uniref:Uncharacterized protein n=1 Tax=Adineta steineri TaxID=433720 RepID=A0A815UEX7_9BILA|nr:unnamed protein product [Adineta steineri]CAF1518563.1 unnamed protein product [Adineta steineri]CAF3609383.1 unnamed protein product [Adineta steineri]CAF4153186.1 unnamed protein product [Adineta steineri]